MGKESINILFIWALFCIILFAYDYTHNKQFTAYIWAFGAINSFVCALIIFLTKRK